MRNILSYTANKYFIGKEIKEWIEYQIEHATSHYEDAVWMKNHYPNINDETKYRIILQPAHEGQPKTVRPFLQKCLI